jgi:hypothetical protein
MNRSFYALALLALVTLAGCMEGSGKPKPIPVSGKVLINSQPAANITVVFTHETDRGISSTGTTGADGTFKLTTDKLNDGARPGTYKVVFTDNDALPVAVRTAPNANKGPMVTDPAYLEAMKNVGTSAPDPAKSRFPAKYGDPTQTPHTKKVETGSQEFEFEIGK